MNEYKPEVEGERTPATPGFDSFGNRAETTVGRLGGYASPILSETEQATTERLIEDLQARADYEDNLLDRLGA